MSLSGVYTRISYTNRENGFIEYANGARAFGHHISSVEQSSNRSDPDNFIMLASSFM